MPPRPDEVRREQLLDQLQEMFLAEGFLHLRIGRLADELRCSRSTLYKLAPSKEALFVLVVERVIEQSNADSRAAAEQEESAVGRVTVFITVMSEWMSRASTQFWADIWSFPPASALFAEDRAIGSQTVTKYLNEGVSSGELRPANTAFIGHVIWLGAAAAREPAVLERDGLDSRAALREIGELVLKGMRPDSPLS